MASTARSNGTKRAAAEIKWSPRESRLLTALQKVKKGDWIGSNSLCVAEYGRDADGWPLNARQIVTGTLASIMEKLRRNRSDGRTLARRGGGRGGNEYRLE